MRYMGDASNPVPGIVIPPLVIPGMPGSGSGGLVFPQSSSGLDPSVKANMLAAAPSVPDATARDLLEVVEATPYGKKQRTIRIAAAVGAGLLLGFLAAKAL